MRRCKGRGSPPIPRPSPFTAPGLRPDRISRSGRGRRPPRRRLPAFGAGSPFTLLRGRMGRLCVQANLPTWHGVKQGKTGRHAPKRRAGRPARGPRRTDRIQCGPRSSRALSGPPWSASGGWGLGEGRPSPWSWGVPGGDSPPFCKALERVRRARVARGPEACRVGDPLGGVVMTSDRHHHAHTPVPRHAALRPAWRLSGGPARCNAVQVEPVAARCRERPGAESPVPGSVT